MGRGKAVSGLKTHDPWLYQQAGRDHISNGAPCIIQAWPGKDERSALRFEVETYNRLTGTEDRREGVEAWNEGRKPNFKGR